MSRSTAWRMRAYRITVKLLGQNGVIPRIVSKQRLSEGRESWGAFLKRGVGGQVSDTANRRIIWFHAASSGELETLWPVAVELAKGGESCEFVLTVLSESARGKVRQLAEALRKQGSSVLFEGYSPWEGSWSESIQCLMPHVLVTAKYEAWPELWASLSEQRVPLVIVCAKIRRSLKICKTVCNSLGARLPKMLLLPVIQEDENELRGLFPEAKVAVAGEPRWDQVKARAQTGSSRAKQIAALLKQLPHPWGVLGSVWPADMDLWKDGVFGGPSTGTFFVVPHRVDEAHLEPIRKGLEDRGLKVLRTTEIEEREPPKDTRFVLVDEMGFLSELYSSADWAYVGGGFGDGVHSTIEPAIHGIPLACGPARSHQFTEIRELTQTGQLKLVRSSHELSEWFESLKNVSENARMTWAQQAAGRLGSTATIARALRAMLSS